MEGKHTQGKWELNQVGVRATVCVNPENPIKTTNIASLFGSTDEEEVKANAKLIASAPELLDALKELMEAEGDEPGETDEQKKAWNKAQKLIKRIEG